MSIYFWSLNSIPLVCVSIFMLDILFWLLQISSSSKSRNVKLPALFFLMIALIIQGLLWFHTDLGVIFICLKWIGILLDCFEFVDGVGLRGYFNHIVSSNLWMRYIFVFSLISLIKVFNFQCPGLSLSWLNLFLSTLLFLILFWMGLFIFQIVHF